MKIIWSREATRQKDAIWEYLADHSVRHADRVEARLEARAGSLAEAPFQGREIGVTDRRRLAIPDIQYVIVYRIEERAIRILRLWNTAQDRSE